MEDILIAQPLPNAPELFARLTERLTRLVPGAAVEHIGSTAVADLSAKPIIDAMLEWPHGVAASALVSIFERDGFWHWYLDPFRATRLMFIEWSDKGIPPRRHANVHVVARDGEFWRDQIDFRDTLRSSPALREDYRALKQELATRFPGDLDAYTEAKTQFVRSVLLSRRS